MKLFLALCLTIIALEVSGQKNIKSPDKKAQKAYDLASQYISSNLYTKAISQLKEAVGLDKDFAAAWQQLGDLHRRMQKYKEAIPFYQRVLQIDPDFHQLTLFGLAECELSVADYSSARQHFSRYAALEDVTEKGRKQAEKFIADCDFALNAIKKPVPFNPVNLGPGINTAASEYLPVVTADEGTMIFTRLSDNNEDFYKSNRPEGKWNAAAYLSQNINTAMFNEGAQCISPDGMYLFFTGCNRPDGLGRCDIFLCRREGKDWSKPFNLGPPVNGPGWESQPSISSDGRTLYFVSSRPGGLGGLDIWQTTLLQGGGWTAPVNLGPEVNTPYDEESPFIHPDGNTLYFSSKGWPGMGRRDLFLSRRDEKGSWQKPLNLGYPINTSNDEGGLTISSDGRTAYFSSDIQGGYGNMDIYSFELSPALRPEPVTYVKGRIFDAKSREPLGAKIRITELKSNAPAYDDESEDGEFLSTMAAGKTYGLTVEKEGYLFYSDNFSLDKPGAAARPYEISVPLQRIEVGSMVILKNIFFDTGKSELLPESRTELQQLISFLNANPKAGIEITGHTDNTGENTANQALSENRARSVFNYLLSNKISASRLSYKGLGASRPIADNKSEEGRQSNRRTEFRISKY